MKRALVIWIWLCAGLNGAGWALSAIHRLTPVGYAVALLAGLAALMVWWRKTPEATPLPVRWHKFHRRFRKPFPLAFLILAALAFLGGALYPPTNYDAMAYRIPRILHWLADGQWHWIHTVFARLNTRAPGMEWVSAPWIAWFKTDRWLFLINFISFLMLPGLVFSAFTRLGVPRRTAWHWMWIVPTGYGFLLQAGSIGNDMFGAVFALAAVDFALRAWKSKSPGDFFTTLVAAGMMTSCKLSNLTLLLPWGLAILPAAKLALRWPGRTAAICALALSVSILQPAVENFRHTGDWTGMAAEQPGMRQAPVFKIGVNLGLAAVQNLVPPVFPWADRWNQMMDGTLPDGMITRMDQTMETAGCRFHVEQMQIEENAGLGFGISVLLLASVAAAWFARPNHPTSNPLWPACIRWSPYVSLLVLLAESNLYAVARLLTPYYVLLLPALLATAAHESVVKRTWWRLAAFMVFAMAAVPLILSPARPLLPVQTILGRMHHPPPRVQIVYSVYRGRHDAFATVLPNLPPGLRILGLVTFDDPETSLWRPFGSRRIVHVCPGDTAADLKARGVEYILVKPEMVATWFHASLDEWMKQINAQPIRKIPLNLRAQQGPRDWWLVRLQ